VVHLFDPRTRCHYNLEALWGDAHAVDTAHFLTA
jgi:ribosomal silencing factor RsfS